MSNGKFSKRKGVATKAMFVILAVVLIVGISVGGTLAWLTAQSETVTNTFTTSDIKVELKETTGTEYKMVPGNTITKNPQATVLTGSEECWLFVKLVKSTNFDSYLEYTMADGWALVTGETNVYARKVTTDEIGTAFNVLKDNQVTVKGSVTKEMMNSFDTDNDGKLSTTEKAALPTLTVTAYASQLYKSASEEFSAADAWANVSNPTGVVTP